MGYKLFEQFQETENDIVYFVFSFQSFQVSSSMTVGELCRSIIGRLGLKSTKGFGLFLIMSQKSKLLDWFVCLFICLFVYFLCFFNDQYYCTTFKSHTGLFTGNRFQVISQKKWHGFNLHIILLGNVRQKILPPSCP